MKLKIIDEFEDLLIKMKYYIPTSSLNYNNILSTESISPKALYEKRGFGYTRWFAVEENNIERVTLLFDSLRIFERPNSDIEDHAMLIEISSEEDFQKLSDGVYYTYKTIYLNPWQTRFIFFTDKVRRIVLSMSDSSLETKMVRLYQRKMVVPKDIDNITRNYPIITNDNIPQTSDIEEIIEEDYTINKMKGLLYGYYIGANMSSSKEYVQKLDSLRELNNIFASIISSYDRIPSLAQKKRLNELFDYLEREQPIYKDLVNELGSIQLVDRVFCVFKRYGYLFKSIDRIKLINDLKSDTGNNPSISWINREIADANAFVDSNKTLLNPEDAEIIVSSKEKFVSQKAVGDELLSRLLKQWINQVLCSHSFNGKVNSIKEPLSDEITKIAKDVIGVDWDNSPVRTYLNQLRRHVRGEEFSQPWNNGVLSSMAAVLIKGDDWEQLLHFMQSKGMYDYRIAYAIYGVLNGFANMTRDFTDHLLNEESSYLSSVYREFYGQLHERRIPEIASSMPEKETDTALKKTFDPINSQEPTINSMNWQNDIKLYAESIIKRGKAKLLKSLEEALAQNADNQDYFVFITMLDNFEGWKPGKNGPSTVWKRMQEHYVPNYNQRIGKSIKKQSTENKVTQQERGLFDGGIEGQQNAVQTVNNVLSRESETKEEWQDLASFAPTPKTQFLSRVGKSILENTEWINECASLIYESRAKRQFIEDMEWFVGNHNDTYNDKKKGTVRGHYAGHERTNARVLERLRAHMENKVKSRNEKMMWLSDIYAKIPINKIIDYISKVYGI